MSPTVVGEGVSWVGTAPKQKAGVHGFAEGYQSEIYTEDLGDDVSLAQWFAYRDDSFGKEIGQSSKYVPGIPPCNENIDLLQWCPK